MTNHLDKIAMECTYCGRGAVSLDKVVSSMYAPALTALIVMMIQDQKYLAVALVIILLMLTKAESLLKFAVLGTLAYFIAIKYWIGLIFFGTFYACSIISFNISLRRVKKLILSGRPLINPFEGMTDIGFLILFESFFLVIALVADGWVSIISWILFGLIFQFILVRYWLRLRPRWSQVHHSLMFHYITYFFQESERSRHENREFSYQKVMLPILKLVYPLMNEYELEKIISNAENKMKTFSDRELLYARARERGLAPDKEVINSLEAFNTYIQTKEGSKLIVKYVLAEVVEPLFGANERADYLLESMISTPTNWVDRRFAAIAAVNSKT